MDDQWIQTSMTTNPVSGGTEGFLKASFPLTCSYVAVVTSNVLGDVSGVVYEGDFVSSWTNSSVTISAHSRATSAVTMGVLAHIVCFI